MNTQHLQYIIEIERTRSISQAAENLFLGQPNLSRILHDLEESLGFRIFERTSRGVRPTERGARFLKHARNMLREMDYIEALGPRHAVPNRLRVCIPRSAKLRGILRRCRRRPIWTREFLNATPAGRLRSSPPGRRRSVLSASAWSTATILRSRRPSRS